MFPVKKVKMRVGVQYLWVGRLVGGGVHLALTINGFTVYTSLRSETRPDRELGDFRGSFKFFA